MERRTRIEFAHCMRHIVNAYPDAEVIRVVLDNLNTHKAASCTKPFRPKRHAPLPASWRFITRPNTAAGSTSQRLNWPSCPTCASRNGFPMSRPCAGDRRQCQQAQRPSHARQVEILYPGCPTQTRSSLSSCFNVRRARHRQPNVPSRARPDCRHLLNGRILPGFGQTIPRIAYISRKSIGGGNDRFMYCARQDSSPLAPSIRSLPERHARIRPINHQHDRQFDQAKPLCCFSYVVTLSQNLRCQPFACPVSLLPSSGGNRPSGRLGLPDANNARISTNANYLIP